MSKPMVRSLSGVALWSLVGLGVWLLTLSAFSWGELLVGAACSVVVGVIAVAAGRSVGTSWKPSRASLRPFLILPLVIASDAVQVLSLPLRRRQGPLGHFETMEINAAKSSPYAATRKAFAILGTTVTPASIVVDVNDEGVMTLHRLPTAGIHMEEAFGKR
jgi:multisubunit Na+/H+ antiporter MnhE subunit